MSRCFCYAFKRIITKILGFTLFPIRCYAVRILHVCDKFEKAKMQKNEQKCKDVGNFKSRVLVAMFPRRRCLSSKNFASLSLYKSMNFAQTVYLYMFSFQQ